ADFADQAIRLLDHLGLDRVAVVGHSMRALVAQEIALRAPSRVSSVICLNAVFRRPPELAQAVRERAAALGGHGDPQAIAATIARWFGDPIPPDLADAAATARTALESVDAEGYARTYRLFASADTAHVDRLAELATPALFITGSEDRNSTPAMSAAMARLAPSGQCLVLSGEKHMMTIASPKKVTQHITAFLDRAADVAASAQTAFDPIEFRRALGSFLTGVTIVTTVDEAGDPRGFTANSFTSVSLEPPLVLVCIAKKALGHQAFSTSRGFAINILSEDQKAASGIFASKAADKFASVVWQPGQTGNPVIDGSVAVFDCGMEQLVDAGDHSILIGRVHDFTHNGAQPLGYCRGAYVTPGLSQEALAAAPPGTEVGAILESDGRVLFLEAADGSHQLPAGRGLGAASDARSLRGKLAAKAIDADLGFLYAVWDDATDASRTHVYYRGTVGAPLSGDGHVRLVDIDRMADLKIADPAVRSMLARYARERTEDQFGVYVGNEVEGEVRPLAKAAPSAAIHSGHG
ncbi:alpha/beta fold hydrolase, partial [Mesorhizobium sp. M4A.F.Ca.ET.020.02.1.1]|uniref:alpha/beta fold hydrolase n=1 Tax=Mesorhizobium sp. M4A.F.Ca.ET.020.02.1.1 TaxID=2496652 RepID=UPI000FD46C94